MSGQNMDGFGSLMGKLQAALDPGAHEDADVVKRKSKMCLKRQQSKMTRSAYREAQKAKCASKEMTEETASTSAASSVMALQMECSTCN